MSFPFRRLPFLAIREVIKSMDTEELFWLSLLSKKSQNFVMLSIPKNALSAEFIFKEDGFLFELMPKGFIKQAADIVPVVPSITENQSLLTRFSFDGLYVKGGLNSKICMKFEDGTREEFAMEILGFAWDNGIPLDHIYFSLENASSETIQELLNGCQEHTSIFIGTKLPEGFKCTPPPGGYKFESFAVHYAHWVNLDDFLQCRQVDFGPDFPDLTVEYLNDLLEKIVNLESRLVSFVFKLKSIKPTDFATIVKGLSESAIKQGGAWQGLEFERKDGLKLQISLCNGYLDLRR